MRAAVETVEPPQRFGHDLAAMASGVFEMRDVLGWRRKFGVIGPSTNTVVQPDFEMMRPAGVTNQRRPWRLRKAVTRHKHAVSEAPPTPR